MKTPISISMDRENLERLDKDSLTQVLGRSGVVRVALVEYYERKEKSEEKEEKNEKKEG